MHKGILAFVEDPLGKVRPRVGQRTALCPTLPSACATAIRKPLQSEARKHTKPKPIDLTKFTRGVGPRDSTFDGMMRWNPGGLKGFNSVRLKMAPGWALKWCISLDVPPVEWPSGG